ncbi:MAG TPA: Hsp20/alpha crystallin family protein [Paludibacteraceae bacterium]|jgi:HSP20 family protein|nr:Hsp20/alpha crystallin family protein [Paludibacteraceae bacterium]OPZ02160.1 MAG: Spore protein SP21 [Bacteroidetes bacterium ADurb.BinA395]MBP8966034.1 Hsp20/alpha crystallin family protein [Paludibacteraceae bacterium]HOF99288.1 Hsp20/alpha crystallin family protein [Paludibacteraceae bacterium]HOL29542.1 Hsp20/alpha crystallin family protein [Paludibacteraceae bacterium]
MALVKFSDQLPSLFDRLMNNDLFDWTFRNFSETNTTLPSVNIKETNDAYRLEMAAPGLKKEDFKIEVKDGVLSISSEKVGEELKEGEEFTHREYSYQSFVRSFTLPDNVEEDKIEAKYENGILCVNIPKKEEAKAKPVKQIEIQ